MYPIVKSPITRKFRKGYGFSVEELKQANLTVGEAKQFGIKIDMRRKTMYQENVQRILEFVEKVKQERERPVKKEKTPLTALTKISKTNLEKLQDLGIESIEELATLDPDVLAATMKIRKPTARKIVAEARDIIRKKSIKED